MTEVASVHEVPAGDRPVPFACPDITGADVEAVAGVLRSGWITTGSECERLEDDLARWLHADHVVAVSSCTAALEIAFAFLGLPPGARVGVPTWTFAASALVPARYGAVPVLLDVDPRTLNVSMASLVAALDEGLEAVVVVHFGGVPVGADILDECARRGVPVIEDAAHAFGARDHRGLVAGQGTNGAAYSFYATKNLTSAEGGALATDNEELADFARSYRLHGLTRGAWNRYRPDGSPLYDVAVPGIKANLPDVLAALARSQLSRYDAMQASRRGLVQRYRATLASLQGVQVVPAVDDDRSADHLMVVLLPPDVDRSRVVRRLSHEGIGTSVHFQPLHELTWFAAHARIGPGGVDAASSAAPRALSLPLYSRLTYDDVDRVCATLGDVLSRG